MGWNELFSNIDEELNVDAPIVKKKKKERTLFEKIATEIVDDRIDEIDLKGAAEKVGAAAKKAGAAVKEGWRKLAGKIKEVANFGFTKTGFAIGKLMNNKFVLFNRAGDFLTPPAKNVELKKMQGGKGAKSLSMTYTSKAGDMDIFLNNKLDFGFGSQLTNFGAGVMFVVDPQSPGLKEGIDYNEEDLIYEAEDDKEKEYMALDAEIDKLVFNSFSGAGAETLQKDPEVEIAPVTVDYDAFKKELSYIVDLVKEGEVLEGSKIKNLAIYAPTGWGKSQIIESVAAEKGFHYFPIELQKVDINLISGFPYLDKVEDASEEVKKDRLERAKTIVKMAPSEFLPPSGHTGEWLLFFDEFNRAEMEKTSAIMNLLLTGELGGAANLVKTKSGKQELDRYQLPSKIVVVLAMNTGTQKNINDSINLVNDLDIATLERLHRVVHGQYHAPSWYKNFALKGFYGKTKKGKKVLALTRIPNIILQYISSVMNKKGGRDVEAPFLLPITVAGGEPGSGGGERTASPRTWTIIADNMFERGLKEFNKLSPEGKDFYREDAQKIKAMLKEKDDTADGRGRQVKDLPENDDDYLFAAFMNASQNQIRLLAAESPELGDEGVEYVSKMINSYKKKGRTGVSIEDILLNYKNVRPIVKANFSSLGFGTNAKFLAGIFNTLERFKTEEQVRKYMEDKGIPILSSKGITEQIKLTIKALYDDLDFKEDDFATFTHLIESGHKNGDSKIVSELHKKFVKWEVYRDNLIKKIKTKSQVEKELGKIRGGAEKEEANEELINFFKGLKV